MAATSNRRAGLAAALAALLLCACHVELGRYDDYLTAAEAGVVEFRHLNNEQRFDALYDLAAPETRQTMKREDFVAAARNTAKVFGAYKATIKSVDACFPHQVRLVYLSQFEKGDVTEVMAWVIRDGKASLLLYQALPGHSEVKEDPTTKCRRREGNPASPKGDAKA